MATRSAPGPCIPIFHELERAGYLTCEPETVAGKVRKYFRITGAGREALARLRPKIRELVNEVVKEGSGPLRATREQP